MMKATRLDLWLVEHGHYASRAKAQEAIALGCVRLNGRVVTKPSQALLGQEKIEAHAPHPYVSRAALKLVAGLEAFDISPKDKVCLDIGASTGGFTQVLLEKGASHIYAVDVGKGQLHPTLKTNPLVTSLESQDARTLELSTQVDVLVSDVSFISLTLALPHPIGFLKNQGVIIALIKPQFEVGRENIGKGGIVKDTALHRQSCEKIRLFFKNHMIQPLGILPSPLLGSDGNSEFLIGGIKQ
jgi:23S rRNA (cytidine1920-2'-O)/16S rRNA (cytidine1409-2'-O)-methyltransferase